MSDEAEVETEIVYSDGEHALATYGTSAAECAQAFGNLMVQSLQLRQDDPRFSIVLDMLSRLAAQIDPNPKGSRARIGVVKD